MSCTPLFTTEEEEALLESVLIDPSDAEWFMEMADGIPAAYLSILEAWAKRPSQVIKGDVDEWWAQAEEQMNGITRSWQRDSCPPIPGSIAPSGCRLSTSANR